MKLKNTFNTCLLLISSMLMVISNNLIADEPCIISAFGSPMTAPSGTRALAFSPIINNRLFHAHIANNIASVSVESVDITNGLLTAVAGSPFATAAGGFSVSFSPVINNILFAAVSNYAANTVAVYSVDTSTGIFTSVSGSPFATGTLPKTIAFTPVINGSLFAAVLNSGDNTITTYTVNTTTGVFSSPQTTSATASGLYNLAISPLINNKIYVAAVNTNQNSIYLYTLNTDTGVLTAASGSPLPVAGLDLRCIEFSPVFNNRVYALVANSNTLKLYELNTQADSLSLIQTRDAGISLSVAFSPVVNDSLFAASSDTGAKLHVYSVDKTNGNLSELTSSPITVNAFPQGVAFSPPIYNALFLGVASDNGKVTLFMLNLPPYLSGVQSMSCDSSLITVMGIAQPYAGADIFANQTNIGTGSTDSIGNFSISSTTPLMAGTYQIFVKMIAPTGNQLTSCGIISNSIPVTITSCPSPNPAPTPTPSPVPDPVEPTSPAQATMVVSNLTGMIREKYM